ncbi:LysR substrate-binding domain-containing protein [Luteimonas sp. RD2P54]|uniref:LysR substrate-binding domain-containing protein n=1 Tax=Luteimonas endophytica TaxID=3042023 RepID=A0ABT6J4X1_9GAMM|nr:LysR family transcriptional regulator [Luteimonas endophytica]MDH5821868.1 LysR substrate-binding domain-containing protein [Luteimonas endophytica]
MSPDLNLLRMFLAVAEAASFRAAADALGVTRSAVSQGIRRLEDALGVALVQRSTRSVRLTEAGERLHRQVAGPLRTVGAALEEAVDEGPPRGLLRVNVSSIAERFLAGPFVAGFAEAHPGITLDVTVSDDPIDLVAAGFDAGVRLGEVIEQDMVAVPLTGPQRQLAVAAPGYVEAHGVPKHPRELVNHRCIGWRPAPEVAPYRWEFSEDGRDFEVDVNAQVTTNDLRVMLRTALAGGGITFGLEENYRQWVQAGRLVPMLQDYLPPFAGFFLYFPSRHNQPRKLRALVEHVRAFRELE